MLYFQLRQTAERTTGSMDNESKSCLSSNPPLSRQIVLLYHWHHNHDDDEDLLNDGLFSFLTVSPVRL